MKLRGRMLALGQVAVLLWGGLAASPAWAEEQSFRLGNLFGDRFENKTAQLTVTESELRGLGCIVTGASVGAAAVLFSGTAIAFAGGAGAAAAAPVAVPVLATAMWAGCAFGSYAAPGLAWISRNGDAVVERIGKNLPTP